MDANGPVPQFGLPRQIRQRPFKSILLIMGLALLIFVNGQGLTFPPSISGEKVRSPAEPFSFELPLASTGTPTIPVKKTVLLLFPYQSNLPYSTLAIQAIQEEFDSATDLTFDLYCEYLDFNRFPGDTYRKQLLSLYATKYGGKSVDLVMVANQTMLDLWLKHRSEILPHTPVVFYDIVTDRLAMYQFPQDVTGVSAIVDYVQSVRWLLRARPSVNQIVLVHGVGEADQSFIQPVDDLKEALHGQVQLTDLSDLPLAEIKRRVAVLPENSVVLYHLMFEDAAAVKYRPIDVLQELTGVSAVPVISGYDHFIGTGTLGGYMYSVEQQAREAARTSLRILRGEAMSAMPISTGQGNRFIFDHLVLQRWNIPLSALPPDSIVKNRQYSPWELYRSQIIAVGVGFVGLALLVIVLAGLSRQLNTTRLILRHLNANLETQVQERTAALSQSNSRLENEIAERKQAEAERERFVAELQEALGKVKQMEGILPICSFCKRIRDEDGHWQVMESYISTRSEAQFSHGLCPDCAKTRYPEYFGELTKE